MKCQICHMHEWLAGREAALLLAGFLLAAGAVSADVLEVPAEYATIQEAIDAAQSGDVISIANGIYTEQIIIEKAVRLEGQGAGTILASPPSIEARFQLAGAAQKPIVYIHDTHGVTLANLAIDGLDLGSGNDCFVGVAIHEADATLDHLEITRLRAVPLTSAASGLGVVAAADAGAGALVTMTGCWIDAYQKGAVLASGAGVSIEIQACSFFGPGYGLGAATPVGVHVRAGAYAALIENDICWNLSDDPNAGADPLTQVQSAGVYFEDAHPGCQLIENSLTLNDVALVVRGDASIGANLLIENRHAGMVLSDGEQTVTNVNFQGIHQVGIWVIGREAFTSARLTELCLGGPGGDGVDESLIGIRAHGVELPVEVEVEYATITMWNTGVRADGDAHVTMHETGIHGNGLAGFDNRHSTGSQDVTYCWWGDPGGPPPIGIGDPILGTNVTFEPRLLSGADTQIVCGLQREVNTVGPFQPAGCISLDHPLIEDIPILLDRSDNGPLRGFSVVFSLSDEIELAGGVSGITEGTYLEGDPPFRPTYFDATELEPGIYKVDGAILGSPCGPDGSPGDLFYIDIQKRAGQPDGTGQITVSSVVLRDCENLSLPATAGLPAEIPVDTEPPAAVSDLAAAQVKSGNDNDGTTKIALTFGVPVDAEAVAVYRAPFGDYPEYDDGTGAEPATPGYPPAAPWELTTVTASGETDDPAARDFWYYVVFTQDACGNWSAVSNKTAGTLSYHLGDVAAGGDNQVGTADISYLSGSYFAVEGGSGYLADCDVGPTADYSVDGLPTTDNEVGFEDLMMFAINFGQVAAGGPAPIATAREGDLPETPELRLMALPAVSLDPALLEVQLVLEGNRASVKGLHAQIQYDAGSLTLLDVSPGALLAQVEPNFFIHRDFGDVIVLDAARLGTGLAYPGSGVVGVLRFAIENADARVPVLASAVLRGIGNRRLGEDAATISEPVLDHPAAAPDIRPPATVLFGAQPNPFLGVTQLSFALAEETDVSLLVYDASGRLVRTLVDHRLAAGLHSVTWDGTRDHGGRAGVGVYLCKFRAGETAQSAKLFHYR